MKDQKHPTVIDEARGDGSASLPEMILRLRPSYGQELAASECCDYYTHGFNTALKLAAELAEPVLRSRGADLIAAERQRQIEKEGWTPEHDDQHIYRELLRAAACYMGGSRRPFGPDDLWPWCRTHWKPSDDRLRNLAKAGALIAAEIDRLQRQNK